MTQPRRWIAPTICVMVLSVGAVQAAEKDATLENAERLLARAMHEAQETPLAQSREAGPVITALRSARDKDLLPVFEKLEKSTVVENQLYGMIATAVLSKDSKKVDLELLFKPSNSDLVGSAIASLIDAQVLSVEQLQAIAATAREDAHKTMALDELNRRKVLKDRSALVSMLKSNQNPVRYYAAVTLLQSPDSPDAPAALATLTDLAGKNDLREAGLQALMVVRVQKEKIAAAQPWLVQLAGDEKNDEGLRYTAVAALLAMKNPQGPQLLADMIDKQQDMIEQVKLGLISLEFAADIPAASLAPLQRSKSQLAKSIATLAQEMARGTSPGDGTAGLLKLIKEGHPIVLDWAMGYADRSEPGRRMAIREAIISQATIVDGQRGRDYDRAAVAAQRILDDKDNGPAKGREVVASLLKGDNRAVVEAVLAGIYRSDAADESELVLPVWNALSRSATEETAANYAALILAREGKMEPLAWLSGMVMGGTVQNQGFRALAGWYYAKLLGQGDALLKAGLAG